MQINILTILLASFALSQETYLSNKKAALVGFFIGRYGTDTRWGIRDSYSLKGLLQLSYTRSSVLTKKHISNFQKEYFLRLYAP